MKDKDQIDYLKKYKEAKEKGYPFFPDILFKDAVVSLLILIGLIALAYFVGAPLDERADPTDASYTPRPEWYFLFLFQLLKYFPGELEVIGVVLLPTIGILLLFGLPFIDRSRYRHYRNRMGVTIVTILGLVAIVTLTALSIIEAPPPVANVEGDPIAILYTQNCAGCHGPTINVPADMNLHEIIALGQHDEMPAWSGDLSSDQIDALVGFILSPSGYQLFNEYCADCHAAPELVADNPIEIKLSLDEGAAYPAHADLDIPEWAGELSDEQQTSLLNFLIAPDGQRLFVINCAVCHGSSVATNANETELFQMISEGGMHLEMPAWQGRIEQADIDALASYVINPEQNKNVAALYKENCTGCHPGAIPRGNGDFNEVVEIIATGGSHETMPVWGDVLTEEQLTALVSFTYTAAQGTGGELGQDIYARNCVSCHGAFGEGGPNPARPDDVIAPISTSEYLATRDDITLRLIISQGQPNFGMSPFGIANGGPLDEQEIDALVAYIRSWELDPPVDLPPEVSYSSVSLNGGEIFAAVCTQCHGSDASGGIGPSLRSAQFKSTNTPESIFETINLGHEATSMIGWGEVLSSEQIQDLVSFILSLPEGGEDGSTGTSFAATIVPIFDSKCSFCHEGSQADGGWDMSSYQTVMETGDNAPVIIPGDVENSLLAQKLQDLQTDGKKMPPSTSMSEDSIQAILDWILEGAQDN